MPTFLDRYRSGEHESVWTELLANGNDIRHEPIFSDGLAVAYETMIRARENIERLIPRLHNLGYIFESPLSSADPLDDVVYAPPRPDVQERIAELERPAGVLPLSLRAWYEVVGTVNFKGTHPDWPDALLDPLVVYSVERSLDWYHFMVGEVDAGDRGFETIIAPDDYHKSHMSGGPPYAIRLPTYAVDALLLYEWHNTTFVNYLRICFRWGGFPGFARCTNRPTRDLTHLSADLLLM